MKPVKVDEIDFYVSDDGKEVGISISGLAELCGVKKQSIQELISNIEESGNTNAKSLKALSSKDLWCQTDKTMNNAKVIKPDAATNIIYYYAFESKAANEKAKFSLMKFASIGFEKWVKNVVGFEEKEVLSTDEVLRTLLLEFKELKKETKELRNIKGKTKTYYVGFYDMVTTLGEEENLLPDDNTDEFEKTYTLTEWLREFKDIESLGSKAKHNLALSISQTYKQFTNEVPRKEIRRDKNGKINNGVYVYTFRDFWILEKSFNLVMFPKKSQQQ